MDAAQKFMAVKQNTQNVQDVQAEKDLLWAELKSLCYEIRGHRLSNRLLRSAVFALNLILEYKGR